MSSWGRSNTGRGGRGTESEPRQGGSESAAGVGRRSLVVEGGLDWAPQLEVLGNPGKPRGRNVGKQSILLAWGFLASQKGAKLFPKSQGRFSRAQGNAWLGFYIARALLILASFPQQSQGGISCSGSHVDFLAGAPRLPFSTMSKSSSQHG